MIGLWAAAFASGILLVAAAARVAIASAVLALLAAGLLARRRRWLLASALAWLALGTGAGWWQLRPWVPPPAVAGALASGAQVSIEATWVRTARARAGPDGAARALIDLERVAGQPVALRASLGVAKGTLDHLGPGDRVRASVRLSTTDGLANPGRPDPAMQARAQGISLLAFVSTAEGIGRMATGGWWRPRRLAAAAHQAMARAIDRTLPGSRAALLRALVLGERTAAGAEVEAGFKAAGAVHALSVSGLHLTAVAALVFLLLRLLLLRVPGMALRTRPALLAAGAAIPLVLLYTLITGEAVATVRAAWMACLALVAVMLRRRPSLASAIAAAALILLVGSPLLVLDPSFQLSFVSVGALAIAARGPADAEPPGTRGRRVRRWLLQGLGATVAASLATGPLCAHHFAEVTPAAPLGNLLLVPLVELGIVPLGLLGAALGAAVPALGWLPLQLAGLLAGLLLWLADGFRRLAPVLAVWSPTGLETGLMTLAALLALAARGAAAPRRWLAVAAACLVVGGGALGARHVWRRLDPALRVTFLDVGQGDAILIEGPRGFVALVDGGGSVDGRFDPGQRVIVPVLRRKTIGRLDLLVLSHPHPDHLNGLPAVLQGFPVGALWTSGDRGGNPAYDRLLALARSRQVALPAPARLEVNGLVIEPRGPWLDDRIGVAPGLEVNDASLVLQLRFAGRSLLLTGDLEEQGEAELLGRARARARARDGRLAADVLKVPHHGSRTSSGDELLGAVRPGLAVASLARRNRFGFPHPEVIQRYRTGGIRLLRTDRDGAIVTVVDVSGNIRATCVRPCP
jgi:competence protein ComEC